MAESSQSSEGQVKHAFEVFPEVVWKHLFDVIKPVSPETLLNCFNSCGTLKEMLENNKHDWLMKLVFPLLYPYLETPEVLACRRVSKNWKRVVDRYLASHQSQRPFDEATHDISLRSMSTVFLEESSMEVTSLKTNESIMGFMAQMRNYTCSPFIGDYLKIDDTNVVWPINKNGRRRQAGEVPVSIQIAEHKEFWNNSLQLFTTFGTYIKHLDITTDFLWAGMSAKYLLRFLTAIASNLQNLKSLRIGGKFHCFEDGMEGAVRLVDHIQYRRLADLVRYFEANPLPQFSNLEKLELFMIGLPVSLMTVFIGTCVQPERLKCVRIDVGPMGVQERTVFILREPFLNLSEIYVSVNDLDELERTFSGMFGPNGTSPVRMLTVNILTERDDPLIDDARLCNIINAFRSTLQVLNLKVEVFLEEGDEPATNFSLSTIDLPLLKTLNLDRFVFRRDRGSFNTPSLEYLQVTGLNSKRNHSLVSGINVDNQKLTESAIWEDFPNLKEVVLEYWPDEEGVRKQSCTRAMCDIARQN